MGEQPVGVSAWEFDVGLVGGGVEAGDVDRLVMCVAEEVEGEVEQARKVSACLYVVHVVVLYFERRVGEVVKGEEPREEVAAQRERDAALEVSVGKSSDGGRFKDQREQLFGQAGGGLLEGGVDGDLFLSDGNLLVQDIESGLLYGLRFHVQEREEIFGRL